LHVIVATYLLAVAEYFGNGELRTVIQRVIKQRKKANQVCFLKYFCENLQKSF